MRLNSALTPPAELSTPIKAPSSSDRELFLDKEAPCDNDESGPLVIDESFRSKGQGKDDNENDGGSITVSRNRRGARPTFKLGNLRDAAIAYQTVTALEGKYPSRKIEVRPTLAGEYILTPKDDDSAALLRHLAEESDRVILLNPSERSHRIVLERYRVSLPLEAIEAHPMWSPPRGYGQVGIISPPDRCYWCTRDHRHPSWIWAAGGATSCAPTMESL